MVSDVAVGEIGQPLKQVTPVTIPKLTPVTRPHKMAGFVWRFCKSNFQHHHHQTPPPYELTFPKVAQGFARAFSSIIGKEDEYISP